MFNITRMALVAALAGLSATAVAKDYYIGQCPLYPTCSFSSSAVNVPAFSDTETFYLGNWPEPYGTGTYEYTSSLQLVVYGAAGVAPCSGRVCRGAPYTISVTSATLDGVSLIPTLNQYGIMVWTYSGSLAPGQHLLAVTGTATGALWYAHWIGSVRGLTYTLVPNPLPNDD